jgi:serine/threonine-protein kinase
LAQQVASPVPALSTPGTSAPRQLARLIEKCLAKEPGERPQHALALAEQIGDALEERREVPAALRAFVKREGRIISSGGVMVGGYLLLMTTVAAAMAMGPVAATGTVAFVALGLPFGAMIWQARKLLRRGFEPPDVRLAFDHEIAQLREEFIAGGGVEHLTLERMATVATVTFGVAEVLALVAQRAVFGDEARAVMVFAPILGFGFLLSLLVREVLRNRRPHAAPEGWAKLWLGKVGRAAFALARRMGGRPVEGAATTHRATELAISMAAGELFASLPKATRRTLGDVPRIIESLQRDAEALRAHRDALQEALADAGDAADGDEYAEVRALRDQLGERHREVVSTLERMRLDLLRLHAGAMSVEGVTTQLGMARDVAQEVRRLLEARGELERFLKR